MCIEKNLLGGSVRFIEPSNLDSFFLVSDRKKEKNERERERVFSKSFLIAWEFTLLRLLQLHSYPKIGNDWDLMGPNNVGGWWYIDRSYLQTHDDGCIWEREKDSSKMCEPHCFETQFEMFGKRVRKREKRGKKKFCLVLKRWNVFEMKCECVCVCLKRMWVTNCCCTSLVLLEQFKIKGGWNIKWRNGSS